RSTGQLARLSGVPKRTIANWLDGTVRKPQRWQPLVEVAAALHLTDAETSALLQAADHPPLHELRVADLDAADLSLLSPWPAPVDVVDVLRRATPPHNLPAPMTSLIGREDESELIRTYLQRQDVRLLSLVGPPGVGKTRLALHVASTVLPNFEDGVWFVPLAPLTDPTQVLPAIAQTLDLQQAQREVLETLVTYLRRRKTLLVLDNFEHVGEAALGVADLLAACHQLTVLVTSREALRLYGEYEFDIFPLPVPPRTPLPALADLAGYAAVDLFVQRAQAVSPSFRLTAHNAVTVAAACVWLDGLPLAIELAATRVKDLASQEARTQSVAHFQQIQRELRDLPERQRSLRSAIAWSYDLLNTDEQALLRRLSVFAGGCTSAAVEAVFSGEDAVSASVTAILSSLVEKHLVYQEISADGEPRFLLLETIREFALARTENGEEDAARQAHRLLPRSVEKMAGNPPHQEKKSPGCIAWNMTATICAPPCATLQTAQTCTALQFGRTLRRFWYLPGYAKARIWLAQIGAVSGDMSRNGPKFSSIRRLPPPRATMYGPTHSPAVWLALARSTIPELLG
ncbi:MAG: NB-ARC domain-containing protein, partial [Caldilineaceae bacterium]